METAVTTFSAWSSAFGVPPLFAAFILGMVSCYFLWGRKSISLLSAGRTTLDHERRHHHPVEPEHHAIEIPPEVYEHLERGDKISAIKVLRSTARMELVDAKRAVDALAARIGA